MVFEKYARLSSLQLCLRTGRLLFFYLVTLFSINYGDYSEHEFDKLISS